MVRRFIIRAYKRLYVYKASDFT